MQGVVLPKLKKIKLKNIIMWRGTYPLLGIFIVMLLIGAVVSITSSDLKGPIEGQLKAIRIEDMASAYAYTSSTFQKTTTLEAFKRFIAQYSGLRNNDTIKFNSNETTHGVGIVKATLVARGGSETPILYQLTRENTQWKIESMVLMPQNDDDLIENSHTSGTPLAPSLDAAGQTEPVANVATTNTAAAVTPETTDANAMQPYQDSNNLYSLTYPAAWEYKKSEDGILILHKKDVSTTNSSLLSIQAVNNSGSRVSVNQLVEEGEAELKIKAGSFKQVEEGLLPPRANKNETFHGQYVVYSYTLEDHEYKQLQVVYFKSPSQALYVIDFISPTGQFDADLPTARAIISSFTIL